MLWIKWMKFRDGLFLLLVIRCWYFWNVICCYLNDILVNVISEVGIDEVDFLNFFKRNEFGFIIMLWIVGFILVLLVFKCVVMELIINIFILFFLLLIFNILNGLFLLLIDEIVMSVCFVLFCIYFIIDCLVVEWFKKVWKVFL